MAVVIVRHAERLDYKHGRTWVTEAARPWDTPITEHGHEQAGQAGRFLREHLAAKGLPGPTKMYSSPLLRCVETAVGIREGLEKKIPIHVANHLVEGK